MHPGVILNDFEYDAPEVRQSIIPASRLLSSSLCRWFVFWMMTGAAIGRCGVIVLQESRSLTFWPATEFQATSGTLRFDCSCLCTDSWHQKQFCILLFELNSGLYLYFIYFWVYHVIWVVCYQKDLL